MKNNSSGNSTLWENLSILVQNILAHVSITYDGASRSLHIDIIPTDGGTIVIDSPEMLQEPAETRLPSNISAANNDTEVDSKEPAETSSHNM